MDQLWLKAVQFDLDQPQSEYGFSIRLMNENFWTADFTRNAIIEYKKFMYLAATSGEMVSPSGVIDTVWHQHLIFTQSYNQFCKLLGKRIEHVPSTHNPDEFEKFQNAKIRTKEWYEKTFGKQPETYWHYESMYDVLKLPKAKYRLRTLLLFGVLGFLVLWIPAYHLLFDWYIHIENPDFVNYYGALFLLSLLILEIYNRNEMRQIANGFDPKSFLFELTPDELIYLQKRDLEPVIHGRVNRMIAQKKIEIKDNKIALGTNTDWETPIEFAIGQIIDKNTTLFYPALLKQVQTRLEFKTLMGSMQAIVKYFHKSAAFSKLFYFNFIVIAAALLFGLVRLTTGVIRQKPVYFITLLLIIFFVFGAVFLYRLSYMMFSHTIANRYKKSLGEMYRDPLNTDWAYFMLGNVVFVSAFIPMRRDADYNSGSSCGSGGSSCSSGGSSCGGGCGGCGS